MGDREKFAAEELAIVCSHYDLGIIESVKEFPRGSRRAPKLVIKSDKGEFLLKRRARGKDDPFKVAFCHSIQLFLASKQFPLPHLIGTRDDNNSMFQYGGAVYEMFEYIRGAGYDLSPEATYESGRILALYHKLLRDFSPEFEPPTGGYHNSPAITSSFEQIPVTFSRTNAFQDANEQDVSHTLHMLREVYLEAAAAVEKAGLPAWPQQIVHCDWHPGNMLFRNQRVVAVIDYDAARMQQRAIDLANGALQFSIIGGTDDPGKWPEHVDQIRFKRFIRGYDSVDVVSTAELQVLPWLMVEALVGESVLPIAATGSFGRIEGYGFLQMIERKANWIRKNHQMLMQNIAD